MMSMVVVSPTGSARRRLTRRKERPVHDGTLPVRTFEILGGLLTQSRVVLIPREF